MRGSITKAARQRQTGARKILAIQDSTSEFINCNFRTDKASAFKKKYGE